MKKILIALAVCACAATTSFAQEDYDGGLRRNENRITVFGAVSAPIDWSFDNDKQGKTGFVIGAEYLRYVSTRFAVGFEGSHAYHGSKEYEDIRVKSSMTTGHIAARVNFMPDQPARLYLPFGFGMTDYKEKAVGFGSESETSFSYTLGLGLEFDFSRNVVGGFEARYFYMSLDDEDFMHSYFSSFNFMVKLGYRF